ncbi:MAG: hypothetical protein HQK51_17115 [Oligoflexia bacterium]|nr:hypothetical protein [Oligoflexia bacterium]
MFNAFFFVAYKRRFVEVVVDLTLLFMSLFFAYNLRFEKMFDNYYVNQFLDVVIIFMAVKITLLFWFKLYRGSWEYVALTDLM